jgi:lysophospholipase L1-like esterase
VRKTRVLVALMAATVMTGALPAPVASAAGPAGAHTAGRVQVSGDIARFSWPGVYFEGRFRGTGVGIVLNDAAADYDVQIDGTTVATLVTPGQITYQVTGLSPGVHRVRLVKRSESPWAVSEFGGFVAAPGGALLPGPAPRHRQIEFIGDSYTAGYGNLSASRDCTGDEVNRTTNADVSFGALTARRLHADYQLNAFSGRGMVRNYNGGEPGTSYRTYYQRALLSEAGDVWRPGRWRPQVVVVGLGINDFSTALNPGEQWTPETLIDAYRTAYLGFIAELRARYGPRTTIVVSATPVSGTTQPAEAAQQVVRERNAQGDSNVRYWFYDSAGLDYGGCHWHPSAHDHVVIADRLEAFLRTLRW